LAGSVRTRVLIAVSLAALLVTMGIFHVARAVLDRSFANIEADTVKQGVERVRKALESDLDQLETTTNDYAQWDDTYRYTTGQGPEFVASNFTRETLENLRLDVVWISDQKGATVLLLGTDAAASTGVTKLTGEAAALLEKQRLAIESHRQNSALERLIRMPNGVLAYSSEPIMHSDRTGPAAGTLFFGRYLDTAEIERAATTSQLPIAFTFIDGSAKEKASLPERVRRWLASNPIETTLTDLQVRDADVSNGYALLKDIAGAPLAVFATSVHRDVLILGQQTITGVVIALIAGFTFVVLALIFIINRSHTARESSELRYQSVIQQLDESILLVDVDSGRIVEANAALLNSLGYDTDSIGKIRMEQLSPSLSPSALQRMRERGSSTRRRVLMMHGQDGRKVPMEVTTTWLKLEDQTLACVVARDITTRRIAERQQRQNRRRLARLAHHDSLTGLPNRLYLQSKLPKLIVNADRDRSLLALMYIDLDHFKDVNDSLGHSSGDRLLASVAKRLRSCVASGDLVVRMGGDEFVVIATGLPAVSAVDYIARRIQETLSAPIDIDGVRLGVVVSIGISVYPSDGTNLEQLLKHADIALYQAKDRGRGNHQFFTDEMKASLTDRLELEQSLRRAVGTEQLFLDYQPSFDLNTGKPVSFEALARWNHPEMGLIPPGRFIPIAEQGSLILELGTWVLRRVCKQLAEWQSEGLPLLPVSINVTSRHFEHGRLVETVADLTREFDIDANLLHFEITESAVMHNSEQHLGALQALRNLGSRILIDDFGTGYSSLSYLKHLPIDTLKIDRAFVRDMATDPNDAAIVSAIIAVASSLGLHVVAEGVETSEQVQALLRLNCQTGQGFYFSRPISPDQCRIVLNRLNQRRTSDTARLRLLKHHP
jgi:diguanylate cyclase (GGDEF)-like protein/PAS domain S-box-containing protein